MAITDPLVSSHHNRSSRRYSSLHSPAMPSTAASSPANPSSAWAVGHRNRNPAPRQPSIAGSAPPSLALPGTATGAPPHASPGILPSRNSPATSMRRWPGSVPLSGFSPAAAPTSATSGPPPMAQVQFEAPLPQFAPPRFGQQSHVLPRPVHQRDAFDAACGAEPPHAILVRASAGVLPWFRQGTGVRTAAARQGTGQYLLVEVWMKDPLQRAKD